MSLPLNEKLCHAQHSQLLIIDIQERLASAMPADVLENVIKNNNVLVKAAKELDIPVIHSEQYPKGLGNTVAEITEQLPETSVSIEKTCFSCSETEGFHDLLAKNKRQQIIISGMESHVCVLQSAIQLQRHGYTVYVVEDAICSRKKLNHRNAIDRLRQSGIIVSNVESVLFEWLRDATHPKFKILSKLIK
ncbi:MAG: hydrolase [Gammaproteobacteria bacterium]|nr:hydrolase [Gammaproteobacteria bacterium]